jgi:hypothetical protein
MQKRRQATALQSSAPEVSGTVDRQAGCPSPEKARSRGWRIHCCLCMRLDWPGGAGGRIHEERCMRHPRNSLPRPAESHVVPAKLVLREGGGAGIHLKNEPRASFPRKRESTSWVGGQDHGDSGWLEQDLEDVLQGEPDPPLRSKRTGPTTVRVTCAVSRHG